MSILRTLEPRVQPHVAEFLRYLASRGIKSRLTSGRRSPTTQRKLYADYKAGRSTFPAAPPGKSTHGAGIAFDVVFDNRLPGTRTPYPRPYVLAGELWERMGYTWGGRFSDPIHFDFRRRGA